MIEVNRADLAWALTACLAHTGKREFDFVGFEALANHMHLFATDGYTAGTALLDLEAMTEEQEFALSKKEAQDLLQFVRPRLKRHHEETVKLLHVREQAAQGESGWVYDLHVGLPGEQDESEPLSEVYEAQVPGHDFQSVYGLIMKVKNNRPEDIDILPYKPSTFARFAKAAKDETDRLVLYPRSDGSDIFGASYITVGHRFEGAIAGLSYAMPATETEVTEEEEEAA